MAIGTRALTLLVLAAYGASFLCRASRSLRGDSRQPRASRRGK
jgi:hypothetical protein